MEPKLDEHGTLVRGAVARLRRSGIREIMDLAASLDDVLHLEIGEPSFATPAHIVRAVERAMADGQVKYTLSRGMPALRGLLAEKLRGRNGLDAAPERVVVTGGGTAAIYAALTSLVDTGDGVLVPDPGWPSFTLTVELVRGRPLPYRLLPEQGYEPDLDHVEALAADASVLIVNSPSNPTGAVLAQSTLERLLEIAQRHGLAVLSDEVYEDIVFDMEHVSIGSLGDAERVVTVFSFSKGYAMSGWRVGYALAPGDVAEAMVKVQEAMLASPSWTGQKAAEAALTGPQEPVREMRDAYRSRRDVAVAALREDGLLVGVPRGTFYTMASVGTLGADTYDAARRLLLEERVAVAPGETFGAAGAGTVRLSLASSTAVIVEAIRRISHAVEGAEEVSGAL